MMAIDAKELWRQIAPEEKIELMSKAHAKGVMTAMIVIVVMCTLAVGLHQPWMVWSSLIISPLIFQMAAGQAWRVVKPRTMLEHLAVRSAARRYAFSHKAQDLGLVTVFRGELQEKFDNNNLEEALEAMEVAVETNSESSVWIALFNDAVIAITERRGGAELKMGHLINKKLAVSSNSPSGKEYAPGHQVLISYEDNAGKERSYIITSRYTGALIVFEKKLRNLLAIEANKAELPIPGLEDGDDTPDSLFANQ